MYDIFYPFWPVLDLTAALQDALPLCGGQTNETDSISFRPGGMATTLTVLANLGISTIPYGQVGDDMAGTFLLNAYRKIGIPTDYIEQVKGYDTRKVIVLADSDGLQHAFVSMNNGAFGTIERAVELLKNSRCLCLTGYYPAAAETAPQTSLLLSKAKAMGKPVFFDSGPTFLGLEQSKIEQTLSLCDYIIANEEEGLALGNASTPCLASKNLSVKYGACAVVKAGSDGCWICSDGEPIHIPGIPSKLRDTTGAGDSFLGAFLYGIIKKHPASAAAVLANAAGAVMVEKLGSGDLAPTRREISEKLRQARQDPSFYFTEE